MVGSKRGHAKSLALKTKDLCYRHFGTLKMDKVELIIALCAGLMSLRDSISRTNLEE